MSRKPWPTYTSAVRLHVMELDATNTDAVAKIAKSEALIR